MLRRALGGVCQCSPTYNETPIYPATHQSIQPHRPSIHTRKETIHSRKETILNTNQSIQTTGPSHPTHPSIYSFTQRDHPTHPSIYPFTQRDQPSNTPTNQSMQTCKQVSKLIQHPTNLSSRTIQPHRSSIQPHKETIHSRNETIHTRNETIHSRNETIPNTPINLSSYATRPSNKVLKGDGPPPSHNPGQERARGVTTHPHPPPIQHTNQSIQSRNETNPTHQMIYPVTQ